MALIFVLSGQESLDSGLGWIDTVGRKLVHFAEYALLCGLWWRALRTVTSDERAILAALVIASAYAVSDEVHQSYVAGRNGSPVDWAIDSAGAATAAFALWRSRRAPSEVTT
jgi:VanZ family protein